MQIGILGNSGSWYVDQLQQAGQRRGHVVSRLEFPRIVASCDSHRSSFWSTLNSEGPGDDATSCLDLAALDAILIRTMPPGSLEQVVYRMDVLAQLDSRGVTVMNSPKSVECAVDKYLTTARLQAAGLPVPQTVVCENSDDALAAFAMLGRDVVVKPIFGSEGRGILRVSDPDLALRTFRTLERLQAMLYLQRFVDHPGHDVRVLVLDGQVLGGMRRVSENDFRTNVSREGRGEPHRVTDIEADWALRSAAAVGARFAGIDILYDKSGQGFVIEVNAVPGWRAFQKVTSTDVADLVVRSLE